MSNLERLWGAYRALLRASWATALEYRAQVVIWLLSSIFPLVMMAVWLAVVREAGTVTGWGSADFISYYVASTLVYQATGSWLLWDLDDDIRTGNLSVKLLKPLDPMHQFLVNQLGWKFIILGLLAPILTGLAWFSPTINYRHDPAHLLAFVLSLVLGFGVNSFMAATFGMIAFWSTQSGNLYGFFIGVGQFLSGWIAPLPLFPAGFRQLASWLPFRSTLGLPVEILSGRLSWAEIGFGLGVSLGWLLVFLVVYRGLWRLGIRRYEAVGA